MAIRKLVAAVAATLLTLGTVLLIASPIALWYRHVLLNTDRFVTTVNPAATDPDVQDAIIAELNRHLVGAVGALADQAPSNGVAGVTVRALRRGVEELTETVIARFVRGPQFPALWTRVVRTAHPQVAYLVAGAAPPDGTPLAIRDDQIVVDLAPIVEGIKSRLVDAGIPGASRIPVTSTNFEIGEVSQLPGNRNVARGLSTAALWAPWVGVGAIGVGIALSRRRRRAIVATAAGAAIGFAAVSLWILHLRDNYLDAIPADRLTPAAASQFFELLTAPLRDLLRVAFVVAAVIFIGAALARFRGYAREFVRRAIRLLRWTVRRAVSWTLQRAVLPYATVIGALCVAALALNAASDTTLTVLIALTVAALIALATARVFLLRRRQLAAQAQAD